MKRNMLIPDNKDSLEDNLNDNDTKIIIELSSDYYEAYITVQSETNEFTVTRDDILSALNDKNITYGIDNAVIDSIIINPKIAKRLKIAKGKKHGHGTDGKIVYNFSTDNKPKPTVLSNGKVDHKNLNYFLKVNKGEILAQKIPPTMGEDGITVTGRTIKAKPGKDVAFKTGRNVIVSDDGLYVIANDTGLIKFIDDKIEVVKVLEINGNVGIETGNINFNGKVIVRGNVEKGYIIKCEDDVEIFGIVEGSEIISKGNIIIHKGVHKNGRLISNGDIISNFMESCYVEAEGNVTCDTIVHCHIFVKGKVIAQNKRGLIVGGYLKVRREITAKTIGSEIGTATKIELGIDSVLIHELKEIKEMIEETKGNINKLDQAIKILEEQLKKNSDRIKINELLNKTLNSKKEYLNKLSNLEEELNKIYSIIESLKSCKINSNIIYPGVKIKINDSYYNVRSILKNVSLIKEEGEIKTLPNLGGVG